MRGISTRIVGPPEPGVPELTCLWRMDRNDPSVRYSWFFGRNSRAWTQGHRDAYSTSFFSRSGDRTDLSLGWAYLFQFRDGSRGACRVRDVNPALRALGHEVDREAEPTG